MTEILRRGQDLNLSMARSGQAFTYRHYLKKCDDATCLGAERERRGPPGSMSGRWLAASPSHGTGGTAREAGAPQPVVQLSRRLEGQYNRGQRRRPGATAARRSKVPPEPTRTFATGTPTTYLDREVSGWPASRSGEGWWRIAPHLGCRFGCSLGAEGTQIARARPSYSNGSQPFSLLTIVSPILHAHPGFSRR